MKINCHLCQGYKFDGWKCWRFAHVANMKKMSIKPLHLLDFCVPIPIQQIHVFAYTLADSAKNANLELQLYHIFAPFANISKSIFRPVSIRAVSRWPRSNQTNYSNNNFLYFLPFRRDGYKISSQLHFIPSYFFNISWQ